MELGPARKPALPTVSLAAAGAAAVSLAVVAVPFLRMSFEAPSLRVALETGGSLLAVTTVVLLLRQCRAGARADHIWLSAGLLTIAMSKLVVAAMVVAETASPVARRASLGGFLAGALMLAIAAFAPPRATRRSGRKVWLSAAAVGVLVTALGALLAGEAPTSAGHVVVETSSVIALLAAGVGFARRAGLRDEALLRGAAVSVVLGAFAKVDYALFPSADAGTVHLGDALRVLGWVALLAGVIADLRARMTARTTAAIELERRRLARELHDGVAQELAFIRRRAGRLSLEADGLEILDAAERALEDSRRAIEALVPPAHQPLNVAMERLGARLAVECDVEVRVTVRDPGAVADEVRQELMKIVSEAVRNAAHHGGAQHVSVILQGAPLAVRVIDDGCGFGDGASSGRGVAGYGLIAMRERAQQVGASFSLESVRDAGTLVQVVLP